MAQPLSKLDAQDQLIPMTLDAFRSLTAELERTTKELDCLQDTLSADPAATAERLEDPAGLAWEQRRLNSRREMLDEVLGRALVVATTEGTVVVGSRVRVRDMENVLDDYTLVAPGGSDWRDGRITMESPLGRALMGHRAGETVEVRAPAGKRTVTLVHVS